ncbi:MAG: hypothetical protein P9L96_01370 [Candidatus Gygaella obscura]|nr:hypothetical protein [Candidatus Gygaella obscura]
MGKVIITILVGLTIGINSVYAMVDESSRNLVIKGKENRNYIQQSVIVDDFGSLTNLRKF